MNTSYAALRRIASFVLMLGALMCAGSAVAQVELDTRPASPNVGDYVTLNITGVFPREDFWVVETKLFSVTPKPGSSNDFVAEVDVYYHWAPLYDGPEVRTVFSTSVGLGQFDRPGTVEVVLRALPIGGVPAYYDVAQPIVYTFNVGSGTPTCGNELNLVRGQSCTPTVRFDTYRFGERSAEVPIIIRNNGSLPIYFGPFEMTNADFGFTRDCGETLEPRTACEVRVTFSPSLIGASPGRLLIRYADDPDARPFETAHVVLLAQSPVSAVAQVTTGARVVEYHAQSTDQYFATANENEMRVLDDPSSGWRRSGVVFHADGDFAVCRFYGDLVGGPRGHFYTARIDQCDALRTQDSISPRGRNVYRFEGLAFSVSLPRLPFQNDGWRCSERTRPIYQMYRPAGNGRDVGYRLVAGGSVAGGPNGDDIVRTMLQNGWWYQGHVMCTGREPEEEAQ